MKKDNSARIFSILARNSPVAVVFRRGPSKQVELLSWNRQTDEFVAGQWLKGRIYERRADLSPTGKYLIYFAANHKPPHYSWTAISKPPYLTALAIWSTRSTWGGGGLFESEFNLRLNGVGQEIEEKQLPKKFKLSSISAAPETFNIAGFGIYRRRLERDGWRFQEQLPDSFICTKELNGFKLEMHETSGNVDGSGSFEETIYRLVGESSKEILFEQLDWADFDQNGDLLLAREGGIFRIRREKLDTGCNINKSTMICDLKAHKFKEVESPAGYSNLDK